MAASTKTDVALGTVLIPHEGPEEYDNIWQKVRSIWSYVYDNYYEKVWTCKCFSCSKLFGRLTFLVLSWLASMTIFISGEMIYIWLWRTCGCIWKAKRFNKLLMGVPFHLMSWPPLARQIRRRLCSWGVGLLKTGIEIECLTLAAVATQLTKVSYNLSFVGNYWYNGNLCFSICTATLKTLVVDALPNCLLHTKTAAEDTSVATCLKKVSEIRRTI